MDLNISKTNSNQENQLLLNAIRNKFDAQKSTEIKAFSPPKFNIPLLKIPENITLGNIISDDKTNQPSKPVSQLSQFLLQLQEKCTKNDICKGPTEFVLPQLQSSTDKVAAKFELPTLKPQSASGSIDSLTTAITNLQVQQYECDEVLPKLPKPAAIDLTTALATRLQTHQCTPPTRDFIKPQQNNDKLDFEIPFIDCDRLDVSEKRGILLPSSNEYCVTDISQLLLHHSLAEPSVLGRFLSIEDNKYMAPLPLKSLSSAYRQQRVKHKIEPFRFETKSPDDLVLLALNKYQRRHYN